MADDFETAFAEAVKEDDKAAPDAPPAASAAPAEPPAASAGTNNDDFKIPDDEAAKEAADKAAADATAKAASDKAAADAAAKAAADAAKPPAVDAAKEAADKAAEDAKAAADKAAAEAAKAPAPDAAAKEAADKAAADATAKAASDKAAADAAAKAAAEAAKPPAKVDPPPEEPKFDAPFQMTDDDKAAVAEVEKEWPDVSKGIAVLMRKQQHESEQKFAAALYAVVKNIGEIVRPVMAAHQETAHEKHHRVISEKHDDYQALVPKVREWIASQPTYLQSPMNAVLTDGDADEVVDLYTRFKAANGITATAASTTAAADAKAASDKAAADAAAAVKTPAPDAAAVAAAAALAPVKSKSSTPVPAAGTVDKTDYAGAWAQIEAEDRATAKG